MISHAPAVLTVDPASPVSLVRQIYEALRGRIVSGRLPVASRLPASRTLALELGVSRATVVAAYDQLVAEGYGESRPGSGIYVSNIGELDIDLDKAGPAPARPLGDPGPARQRPFEPGRPDLSLFPARQWARCVARVARTAPHSLIGGGSMFGDPRLRTAVARHLAEWRGLDVAPEQIMMTAGAGDAVEICVRTLARAGDVIALEDPGYQPLRHFVDSLGLEVSWLDVGEQGAMPPDPADRQRPPVLTLITPSHQFPLGGVMPTSTRLAYLRRAEETGGWVIEDDYDSEFRYAGRPIPALASLDGGGRAIYVGSFSKIFSAGLRLGFLVMPEALIDAFARTLSVFGTKASIAPQRALAVFIEDGEFHRHIRRMRRIYSQRRGAFLALLQDELGHLVSFQDHQAGMHVAVTVPPGADDKAVSAAAAAQGIVCPPLSAYCVRAPARQGLLLGFCPFKPEDMVQSIRRLRTIIEAALPG